MNPATPSDPGRLSSPPEPVLARTGARLHCGLVRPRERPGERRFGGCGFMIDQPGTRVAVTPAAEWSASGPSAERALEFARRLAGPESPPLRIDVRACPPPHHGLGSGTQLALAVGSAVCQALGRSTPPLADLARQLGRGARSGLGIHGFARGGFLVDGGKRDRAGVAPLLARVEVPEEWRIILAVPPVAASWHGSRERDAFTDLGRAADDVLCRLILLDMLPALIEGDLPTFGEALHEYNRRAGEPFAAVQGGPYAASEIAALIAWLRGHGAPAVGQSSWGPTVFAIVAGEEPALALLDAALGAHPGLTGMVAKPLNRGAEMKHGEPAI